jgi:hypothetical protein
MTPAGFPHSDIPGSTRICRYPRLFAAYHVLHRLLVPRHPPCALSSLTGHPSVLVALTRFSYSVVKDQATTFRSGARVAQCAGCERHLCRIASRIYRRRGAGIFEAAHPLLAARAGGDSGSRTRNLRLAKPALCQLSYIPGREDVSTIRGRGSERWRGGGPEWTRTTHLALIRRAL